ncbi:hypothetical protein RJ639_025787, partial [Escallonia herrerae]
IPKDCKRNSREMQLQGSMIPKDCKRNSREMELQGSMNLICQASIGTLPDFVLAAQRERRAAFKLTRQDRATRGEGVGSEAEREGRVGDGVGEEGLDRPVGVGEGESKTAQYKMHSSTVEFYVYDSANEKMGRVKLKMQTLESTGNRQVTYSKRRSGIIKKARELSILCGIDIILLMFAPNGRPTMFSGVHSKVDEVITKFAQLSPYERKMESLELNALNFTNVVFPSKPLEEVSVFVEKF